MRLSSYAAARHLALTQSQTTSWFAVATVHSRSCVSYSQLSGSLGPYRRCCLSVPLYHRSPSHHPRQACTISGRLCSRVPLASSSRECSMLDCWPTPKSSVLCRGSSSGFILAARQLRLRSLTQTIASRQGKPTYVAFLNISKAYDTVWRDGLWYKLQHIGVTHTMLAMSLFVASCCSLECLCCVSLCACFCVLECQQKHWKDHKRVCKQNAKRRSEFDEAKLQQKQQQQQQQQQNEQK